MATIEIRHSDGDLILPTSQCDQIKFEKLGIVSNDDKKECLNHTFVFFNGRPIPFHIEPYSFSRKVLFPHKTQQTHLLSPAPNYVSLRLPEKHTMEEESDLYVLYYDFL